MSGNRFSLTRLCYRPVTSHSGSDQACAANSSIAYCSMIYAHPRTPKKTKAEEGSIAKKEIDHDRDKLVTRARRIRGQIEAVERALINEEEDCADTLQLLAACRGAINSLMAEVMEGHIREHIGRGRASEEVTDDLLAIVRAYLK